MERFLHGQAEDELRDLVKKMKGEGVKSSVIACQLAKHFGVECHAGDGAGEVNDIVSSGCDIKFEFENDKTEVVLVRGEWKCSQCIEMRSAKKITGQGESATVVSIAGMNIDIPKPAVVEIRYLCIQNTGEDESEIRIAASKVNFVGVRFEGVRIEAVEGSSVSLQGCSFSGVKQALHRDSDSTIGKGDTILGAGVVDDQHDEQVVAVLKAIFDAPKATTEAKCRAASLEMIDACERMAESGNPEAQCLLGECYNEGIYRTEDESKALHWFRKAAEQGSASGQSKLGDCYCYGFGVKEDELEAVKWYREAADQKNGDGLGNLGVCYLNGWGVDKDEQEAVIWFHKAIEQGAIGTLLNLFPDPSEMSFSQAKEAVKDIQDNFGLVVFMGREWFEGRKDNNVGGREPVMEVCRVQWNELTRNWGAEFSDPRFLTVQEAKKSVALIDDIFSLILFAGREWIAGRKDNNVGGRADAMEACRVRWNELELA